MSLMNQVTALPILVLLALPLSACQKNTETAPEAVTTDSQDAAPITDPTNDTAAAHDDHNHSDDAHDHEHDSEHHEHAGHDHDHDTVAMTTYSCQPEQTIKVRYDTDTAHSTPPGAHLLIDDIEYELTPMLTTLAAGVANAVVYETDIGLSDDAGMYWQVNGNQANLVNKTLDVNSLDGDTLPENETTLFTCEQAAS